MIQPRKLAAVDMALLGAGLIIGEYIFAVLLSAALGVFILLRSRSPGQLAFGFYILSLGINYVPLLIYAVKIGTRAQAAAEIHSDLEDRRAAAARFRKQTIYLLIPLIVAVAAVRDELSANRE